MNTDTIDRPQTAVTTTDDKPATLLQTALASFAPIRAHVARLADRYRNVAYDLTTPRGLADAKAARHEIRQEGRFAVQRLRDRLKDEANALKSSLAHEADEIIKIVAPVETSLHAAITAREQEIEDERQARINAEAQRIAEVDARIAAELWVWVARCQVDGITADRIATGIHMLDNSALADYGDRNKHAEDVRRHTLATMRDLHAKAVAREQAAENARVAAELAEQRRALEAQAAELARQQAEAKRVQDEAAAAHRAREQAERAAEQRLVGEYEKREAPEENAKRAAALQEAIDAAKAMEQAISQPPAGPKLMQDHSRQLTEALASKPDAPLHAREAAAAIMASAPAEPAATLPDAAPSPDLKLGTIRDRLQFALTEAFLTEVLGIEPAGRDGRAVLFAESQWPAIKAALVEHVQGC